MFFQLLAQKSKASIVIAFLVSVVFAVPAVAQEDEHAQAALAAVKAARSTEGFNDMLRLISIRVVNGFVRLSPQLEKDIVEVAQAEIDTFKKFRVDVDKGVAEIWKSVFTKEELIEITAFYATPTGMKLVQNNPRLLGQTFGTIDRIGNQLEKKLSVNVRAGLKKRGHDL